MTIIDLNAERSARERPDAEFSRRDDFGREMYCYTLEYQFQDGCWRAEVWAYSMEEAEQRVAAMRESLTLRGQVYTRVPA